MPKSAVPDRASRHDQKIRHRSEQHHRDQCSRPPDTDDPERADAELNDDDHQEHQRPYE